MTTFVAVYRGQTVNSARLIAVTADPAIVQYVADRLLAGQPDPDDPVIALLDRGKRDALRHIRDEVDEE